MAEGRITSLRKVDWGSMRVNFFVMFPTRADGRRAVHATSPRFARRRRDAAKAAASTTRSRANSRTSPTIDVSASIAQVQRVLDQVIRAVEFLFGFTLAAGLVVLFAAVTATREARAREFAMMRAMGASGTLLAQVQRAELLGVGALAGFLRRWRRSPSAGRWRRYAFEFSWNASPLVPVVGACRRRAAGAGGGVVGAA